MSIQSRRTVCELIDSRASEPSEQLNAQLIAYKVYTTATAAEAAAGVAAGTPAASGPVTTGTATAFFVIALSTQSIMAGS